MKVEKENYRTHSGLGYAKVYRTDTHQWMRQVFRVGILLHILLLWRSKPYDLSKTEVNKYCTINDQVEISTLFISQAKNNCGKRAACNLPLEKSTGERDQSETGTQL